MAKKHAKMMLFGVHSPAEFSSEKKVTNAQLMVDTGQIQFISGDFNLPRVECTLVDDPQGDTGPKWLSPNEISLSGEERRILDRCIRRERIRLIRLKKRPMVPKDTSTRQSRPCSSGR